MRTIFSPIKKCSQVSPNLKVAFEYIGRPASFCQATKFFVLWQLSFVRSSYFANMTNKSSFNWRFWLHEKFRVSQVRTRLQKWKIGYNKIFKFLQTQNAVRPWRSLTYLHSSLCTAAPSPQKKGGEGAFLRFFLERGGGGSAVHRLPPLLSAKIKTVVESHRIKNALQSRNVEDAGLS